MSKTDMFRYLEKYVGKYRVLPILDISTGDFPRDASGNIESSYDDLYIPCNKGIIKHSYVPHYLIWYTDRVTMGRNVKKELESKKVPIQYEETDCDVIVWFEEKYIKDIAKVVKPKTIGKNISPFSKRNLTKEKVSYTIPEKDASLYSDIIKELSLPDKMKFGKIVIKEFDEIIKSKKGKKYNILEEREESGLSNKEFIHYIGLWKEFIKFSKQKYGELYN